MSKQQSPSLRFNGFLGVWEEKKLSEIFEISSASRVLKEQWQKEGVPFFRTSDVIANFKGENNEEAFISFELFEDLVKKSGRPQKDDLLVTGGGSIGIPFLIKNDDPIYFKDADLLWFKSAGKIDGGFLFYSFLGKNFKNYLKSISHTGTISHYTIVQAKSTPITLPTTAVEQTQIGHFFRYLDQLIDESRAILEKSRQLKKAMLGKMFPAHGETMPKIRFKGFTGEWEKKKLGDISIIKIGESNREDSDLFGEYTFFDRSQDIRRSNTYLYDSEAIIMAGEGSEFIPKYFVGKFDLHQRSYAIMNFQECNGLFIFYYLHLMNDYFCNQAVGSTVKSLRLPMFTEMPIILPNKDEQTQIGNFFRQLDETIALQQAELEKLNQFKKGLLATLLV